MKTEFINENKNENKIKNDRRPTTEVIGAFFIHIFFFTSYFTKFIIFDYLVEENNKKKLIKINFRRLKSSQNFLENIIDFYTSYKLLTSN